MDPYPSLNAAPSKVQPSGLIGLLVDRQADHSPSNQSPVSAVPQIMWQGEPLHPMPHVSNRTSQSQSISYPDSHSNPYPMPQDNIMAKQSSYPKPPVPQSSASTIYQPHYAPPNNISFQVMYNKTEPLPSNSIPHYNPYISSTDIYNIQGFNPQSSSQVGLPLWNVQPSQFVTQLSRSVPKTFN